MFAISDVLEKFGGLVQASVTSKNKLPSLTKNLRQALSERSFLIFRGFDVNEPMFETWAKNIGQPIKYAFGEKLVMEALDNSEESQFTEHSMPFHQDTIINLSEKAHLLAFFCIEAPALGDGGETVLSNNRKALAFLPSEARVFLSNTSICYRSLQTSYYEGKGEVVQRPIIKHPRLDVETFFLALDDPSDPKRNYEAKFEETSPTLSKKWMEYFQNYFNQPQFCYAHAWRPGDVILLDNFLVCHSRRQFKLGTKRKLLRFSLTVDDLFYA